MCAVRAFLAIPVSRQLQQAITSVQNELQASIAKARWTHHENLHLTLHFLGEIEQESLEKLKVSMLSVTGSQRPFKVEVKGLGVYPDSHRPRVIWLGLEPQRQLEQLHNTAGRCLRQAGLTTDSRPYSPHLTIGRLRGGKADLTGLVSSMQQKTFASLTVDKVVLYESRLRPEGAQHIPILTVNLDDKNTDSSYAT